MVVSRHLGPAALAVALASATPISHWRRQEDPLGANLPSDFTDRGMCVANDYTSDESRKSVWEAARGGELIDAYLNQNSRDGWITNIAKTIFPEENTNQLDCWSSDALCTVNMHTCSDFTEKTVDGLYQVFVSLQNFHTFVAQYLTNLNDMCDGASRMVQPIVEKFGRDEEPEKLNVMAILSAALGVGAAAAGNNPAAAGVLGGLGGIVSMIGEAAQDESQIPNQALTESGLWSMIDGTCNTAKSRILGALEAVMGVPGSSEDNIPAGMTVDEGKGYNHRIAYLFGNGQWLLDHPTEGMATDFSVVELQMQQALAWQMLRLMHNAVVVINDASDCEDGNEVRDPENGYCYGMMHLNDEQDNLEGGINNVAYPLWAPISEGGLSMDKLYTYRNALDCWLSNDASVGTVEANADPRDTSVPHCMFGMEVKKGSWKDLGSGKHVLTLDKEFQNGLGEDIYWPACDLFSDFQCS